MIKQLEIARLGEITEVTEKTVVLYRNSLLTKHVTHDINIMHNILKVTTKSNQLSQRVVRESLVSRLQ